MRSSITFTTLLSLGLLASFGCVDEAEPNPTNTRAAEFEAKPLPEAARAPVASVAAPELPSPPSSAPAPVPEAWQAWLDAELTRVQAEAPQWFDHVMTVAPKRARSGSWRLVGPELEDPNVTPVLLHRYQSGGESPEVRAAVVAALVGLEGAHAKVVGDLLTAEPDALVRVGLLSSLRRVPGPEALAALELALADADLQVRVSAAVIAGRHPEGASLAAPLIDALDDEPELALAASRSLGYLRVAPATGALAGLLANPDPDLRLASLQAIDRIDPGHAEGLAELATLVADTDPKVARAAQKIAAR
ncbi:MAG: HEAT repeat domain-containing protein [Enhygromyxa sp.]